MTNVSKITLGRNEVPSIWRALLAEFTGIFTLNLFSTLACTHAKGDETLISLAFGLNVFMVVMTIGHVSGGHVNPAVSIGLLVAGKISVLRTILYIITQCAGSVSAIALVKVLLDESYYNGLGHTQLADHVGPLQGFGLEFFLGFLLLLCVFGVGDESKPDSRFSAPLAIGLTVTLGKLGAGAYTGASMNPAGTFGTAVMLGDWRNHWVYWFGPCLGGITASYLYCGVLSEVK